MKVISECRYILFGQTFERWFNKFDDYNGLPFEACREKKKNCAVVVVHVFTMASHGI